MNLIELKWPDVAALSRDVPVVIPVAALEQHGRHMPVFTDSMLLGEIVRRAGERLGERVLWTPLQWLGNSEHHLDFPGSMSAAPRTYLNLLREMAENFIAYGFKRIVFLNGHGGNHVPGSQAVYELRQKYRKRNDLLLLFATYWDLGKPWDTLPELKQRRMGHACEFETSMMLRIAPHLVGDHRATPTVEFGSPFEPAVRGWTMPDRSEPGHIGEANAATAEKGEHLFATFAAGAVAFLERVVAWDGKSWSG
ncbi:MAG: creatininase family protein [Planctomycetaceae bacterium]|nr:creatininase family protein [Planctomycetaceae bacterium]